MQIPANAEKVAITIGGISGLLVPTGLFKAGHQCSEAEAHVLQQTVVENTRNNLREKVKAAGNKNDAQKIVDEYLAGYEFGIGGGGGFRATDPVEAEAMHISRKLIKAAGQKKGVTFTAAELTEKARALLETQKGEEIRKRAKTEVARREKEEAEIAGILG